MPELEKLRQDIDAIDDAMQDLLLKRVVLAREVARIKDGALPLRPEREASILRRLAQRHRGVLPIGSLFRIWREIISSNSQLQARFAVMLWQKENGFDPENIVLWNLVRDFYGFSTSVVVENKVNVILDQIENDPFLLGVLPMPDGSLTGKWWSDLSLRNSRLAIIGCLPILLDGSELGQRISALVVANAPFSPSGLDTSLLSWQLSGETKHFDAGELIKSLEQSVLVLDSDDGEQGKGTRLLLAIDGHSDGSESALRPLREEGTVISLGGYANPWSAREKREVMP